MKGFIEKLIARLEELKSSVMLNNKCCKHIIDKIIEIVNELAEEYNRELPNGDFISRARALEIISNGWGNHWSCKEMCDEINQLAEEMGVAKNAITTWIPCSERLPEVKKEVLICADDNAMFVGRLMNGGFSVHDGDGWIDLKFILAWQPLPPAYIPKSD